MQRERSSRRAKWSQKWITAGVGGQDPAVPLPAAHACDPNQLSKRNMMKFSAFEANCMRVRHVLWVKHWKRITYTQCVALARRTGFAFAFSIFPFSTFSTCRTISLVQKLIRILSAAAWIFFFFLLCYLLRFLCVCVCLPAVSCVRYSLVALEFPFRLLAVFSCFHLISFATLLCCFCFSFLFVLCCVTLSSSCYKRNFLIIKCVYPELIVIFVR